MIQAHIIEGPLDALLELGLPVAILLLLWWWAKRAERRDRDRREEREERGER